jgi:hypothetical protein
MTHFDISFTVSGLWVFQYRVALWVGTDVLEEPAASIVRVGVSRVWRGHFAVVQTLVAGRPFWKVCVCPRDVTTQRTKI